MFYDLETSHNLGAFFGIYDERIPYQNILKERYVICGAWQVMGERKVHSVSVADDKRRFKRDPNDDYHVVKTMRDVIADADIIVAHNGDKFDLRHLNARILVHGFDPLPPSVRSIDTLKIARRHFRFNCNRLDYLGKLMGVGRKTKVEGGLWLRALAGDSDAVECLVRYNKQDVRLLRDVFEKLKPYAGPLWNLRLHGRKSGCTHCGSKNYKKDGFKHTLTRSYQYYKCKDCRKYFGDVRSEKGVTARSL